jgi:hypothetical protein
MKTNYKIESRKLWMATILLATMLTGCNNDSNNIIDDDTPVTSTPSIVSSSVENMGEDVALNAQITATFNESMDSDTLNDLSFTVVDENDTAVIASVTLDSASNTAIFTPTSDFDPATAYTATLSTAVKSALGVPLANAFVWSFTTAAIADTTRPTVSATYPLDNATNFALNLDISAEMSESLDPETVNGNSFTLFAGSTEIAGTTNYNGTTLTFDPDSDLDASTVYTATLTVAISDLAVPANSLATDYVWSFTTGADVAAGPASVNLRTAGNMVILAKTGITNVPTSSITGNIGSSPITAASMDNITCNEISGIIYGSDAAYTGNGDTSCFAGVAADNTLVANAVLDMGTAYTDAAGRTLPDFTEFQAGDLSSQTLQAGLYKWGTNVLISTDMTFNGGANDVWILQIAGDVNLADGVRIHLTGGALAKNIFWQVAGGTGVVIGTTAHFEGIILAEKGITVNTGATVTGRLLAQTAVTLDQNALTQPAQ